MAAPPTTPAPPAPVDDLDDDDRPVGRFLTRREILALFGLSGVALGAAACAPGTAATPGTGSTPSATTGGATPATTPGGTTGATASPTPVGTVGGPIPSCVVVPELTEGPFYVDTGLERSDIRPDTTTGDPAEGIPLQLSWVVSTVEGGGCVPLAGAVVDVWHCDALGVYSGVQGNGGDFLRGVQRTDANGAATFTTIYPGWYQGRAVHIHFAIRTDPDGDSGFSLTSQLFFDDELSRQVFTTEPYVSKGPQDLTNEGDGIFQQSDGTTLLDVQPSDNGYATTFSIALQIS